MLRLAAPLLIAMWGWAALAVGAAAIPLQIVLALAGFAASAMQTRAFRATAVVEGLMIVAITAVTPLEKIGFAAVGALFVVGARVIAVVLARRA